MLRVGRPAGAAPRAGRGPDACAPAQLPLPCRRSGPALAAQTAQRAAERIGSGGFETRTPLPAPAGPVGRLQRVSSTRPPYERCSTPWTLHGDTQRRSAPQSLPASASGSPAAGAGPPAPTLQLRLWQRHSGVAAHSAAAGGVGAAAKPRRHSRRSRRSGCRRRCAYGVGPRERLRLGAPTLGPQAALPLIRRRGCPGRGRDCSSGSSGGCGFETRTTPTGPCSGGGGANRDSGSRSRP